MSIHDDAQPIDVHYKEVGSTTFEASAADLTRREYGRQLASDRLFQGLSSVERDMILSDDIARLDPQRYYSLSDVATMLSGFDWAPDKLSDSSLRYWFSPDVSDLEEYVQVERSGRKRLLPIISVLRMKLIAYWCYAKNFTVQQVNDIALDVERSVKREWSSNANISLKDLQNMRIPPEKTGEFMGWYTNRIFESLEKAFNPVEETAASIRKELGFVKEAHEDMLSEQLQVARQMWEITAKDELRIEAIRLWADSPHRFQKQLFGLVKVEDTTAKELYVADYINTHLAGKVDRMEDDYISRYRAKRARLMRETD